MLVLWFTVTLTLSDAVLLNLEETVWDNFSDDWSLTLC
jgi:hypothetical protein